MSKLPTMSVSSSAGMVVPYFSRVNCIRHRITFAEYVAELKMNPNRFNSLYGAGRAAELAGKIDQAMLYYGQLLTICQGSNSERPELIHAKRMAKDSFRLRSQ